MWRLLHSLLGRDYVKVLYSTDNAPTEILRAIISTEGEWWAHMNPYTGKAWAKLLKDGETTAKGVLIWEPLTDRMIDHYFKGVRY